MIALMILALVAVAATLWLTFVSSRWASAAALAALFLAFFGLPGNMRITEELVLWAVAAAVALGLGFMLPPDVSRSRAGVGYLFLASLAGGLVAYIADIHYVVVGTVAGALLGALAWARTPVGAQAARFPSGAWVQFVASKGLPVMVNVSIACIVAYQAIYALSVLVNAG